MIYFPSVEIPESQQLLSALFDNSNVGLALIDEHCRYRMVNPCLAVLNCTPIKSHLGKHVREILGEIAFQVEPAIQRVFATAKPLFNCKCEGELPTKTHTCRSYNFFPVMDSNGGVAQVASVVVELRKDILAKTAVDSSASSTVLRSWKDIANYVGTSVKTVQRWERTHNFPVRRVQPSKGSVVFALRDEVDDWLRSRDKSLCE